MLGAGGHDHHLARCEEKRIAERAVAREAQAAFQNEHLEMFCGHVFHHDGGAGDRRGNSRGANARPAESFWDLQQQCSLLQGKVARSRVEAEVGFRPDAGQRLVFKHQLRA